MISLIKIFRKNIGLILFGTILSAFLRTGLAISSQNAIDSAILGESVLPWVLLGILATGSYAFGEFLKTTQIRKAREALTLNLRDKYYSKFMYAGFRESEKYSTGEKMTLLTDDIDIAAGYPASLAIMTFGIIQTISGFVYCLNTSMILTAIAFVCVGGSFFLNKHYGLKIKEITAEKQKEEAIVKSFLQDRMRNKEVTQVFGLKNYHGEKFNQLYQKRIKQVKHLERTNSFYTCLSGFAGAMSSTIVVIAGILLIGRKMLSYGEFMGFLEITSILYWPFLSLPSLISDFSKQKISYERLLTIEDLTEEKQASECNDFTLEKLIAENLDFGYTKENKIIENFAMNVEKGQIVGIIGGSGRGKTTLLNLLNSIFQGDNGEVYALGNSGRKVSGIDLRSLISYVPQKNLLFNGTIRENISLGRDKKTLVEIIYAAEKAGIHDFISSLPKSYETEVSEDGKSLSEGQRQRISLARAFLKNAPILLLDEASSSLDDDSECKIIEAIKENSRGKITVLVTHTGKMKEICDFLVEI